MYNLTTRLATSRGSAVTLGILSAIIAAVLLTVYVKHYRSSVKSDAAPASVVVAKRLITAGTTGSEIGRKQLYSVTSVPKNGLKAGAITDLGALNGQIATRDIFAGQQLTSADFASTGDAGTASVLSTQLKASERAVMVQVDSINGDVANLRPGDHIDIYQQVTTSGQTGTIIKLFRPNVPVLQVSAEGGSGQVVLSVPTRDAADVLYAAKHTDLSFVLRPANGASPTPATTANNQTMLQFSNTH